MERPADTDADIAAWRAARGLPTPDAMAAYLDGALAEAQGHLNACAEGGVPDRFRAPIAALAGEVEAMRRRLGWAGGGVFEGVGGPKDPALAALTRAALKDVERAALVEAFRDRCGSLPARLAEPDGAEPAVDELTAALRVLTRALGLSPATP